MNNITQRIQKMNDLIRMMKDECSKENANWANRLNISYNINDYVIEQYFYDEVLDRIEHLAKKLEEKI